MKIHEKEETWEKRVPVRKIEGSHLIRHEERDTLFGLHEIR